MIAVLAAASLACAGCSWMIGVSEDPVVVVAGDDSGPGAADASRPDARDAAPAQDAAAADAAEAADARDAKDG